ncbi:chalcone isomerase [Pavlovales sp. CCMP2436]|nr:chalcone isomerase [Pavlovales sp. CCMP2436]|mmetsp:Transcript_27264/g.63789  ORF Transcript_27264/g.63789 Transcript_27264/m.63789 type:complete len:208 (+) Transcript_27264:35-658(+)
MARWWQAVGAALALACLVEGAKDQATGISFPDTYGGAKLAGVGTRYKGPLKIYSAGVYVNPTLTKFKLGKYKGTPVDAVKQDFYQDLVKADVAKTIVLKMAMGISREKLASALSDSVKPRMVGDLAAVPKFAEAILAGFAAGGKASSGTELAFGLKGSSMCVSVNGKPCGAIKSPALVSALLRCYLDDKAVSPALKKACAHGVLGML